MQAVVQLPLINPLLNLGATARHVLEAYEKTLAARGVEVPEVKFVAPGAEVAWDGEQLSVNFSTIDQGIPGQPFGGTMPPTVTYFAVQFGINLLRVVPGLSGEGDYESMLPTPQEQEAAANTTMNDAAMLTLASVDIHKQHLINDPNEGYAIGPVSSFGPQGNLVGSRCLVTMNLT